jgi:hypothetical protein
MSNNSKDSSSTVIYTPFERAFNIMLIERITSQSKLSKVYGDIKLSRNVYLREFNLPDTTTDLPHPITYDQKVAYDNIKYYETLTDTQKEAYGYITYQERFITLRHGCNATINTL